MLTIVELKYLRIFRTYIWNSLRLAGALDLDYRKRGLNSPALKIQL